MSHKKLLVIDDEVDMCELLTDHLQSLGYTIFSALDIKEALHILKEQSIDLILTDFNLPDATAFDLLEGQEGPSPPVIIMTGVVSFSIEDIIKKGAVAVLEKPINFDQIGLLIKDALK